MSEKTRVLIVDDSVTMRALFTSALEKSSDIIVLDSACDADEARDLIAQLKPDIITLDIEMPGMNGIDFLEEIMTTNPMPVIMLSTLTQKGAEISLRAMELGAIDCFPKPKQASPDEFDKISDKLCKLVVAAAKSNVKKPAPRPAARPVEADAGFKWNGSIVAMAASTGGVEAYMECLASYPPNCPPTIILQQMEEGLALSFASKLNKTITPEVKLAEDGQKLEQGIVYVAADPSAHVVVDRWPGGTLRLLPRDPVKGFRPSADLLFAALAKTAGARGIAAILTGMGEDGAMGMGALKVSGAQTFCQTPDSALVREVIDAVIAKDPTIRQLPLDALCAAILENASFDKAAA
jgi:two-component system, chemotaxis family, protein-glutamate methylesterase/glutaminase